VISKLDTNVLATVSSKLGTKPDILPHHPFLSSLKPSQCEIIGCAQGAIYDFPRFFSAALCHDHKLSGMIQYFPRSQTNKSRTSEGGKSKEASKCYYKGCSSSQARFSCKEGTACWKHKAAPKVDSKGVCVAPQCRFPGLYFYPLASSGGRGFCHEHKTEEMTLRDKRAKLCESMSCVLAAEFNYADQPLRKYCEQHKIAGMVNKRQQHKTCRMQGCTRYINFNYKNAKTGKLQNRYCINHLAERNGGGVVLRRGCQAHGCTVHPAYGDARPDDPSRPLSRRFCAKHRLPGMVKAPDKKSCQHEGCDKHAAYNFDGLTARRFCAEHKHEGMVNLPYMYRMRKLQAAAAAKV